MEPILAELSLLSLLVENLKLEDICEGLKQSYANLLGLNIMIVL